MYTVIARGLVPLVSQLPRRKYCSSCDTNLPRGHFWKNRSKKDGLDDLCRDCREEANKRWRNKQETFEFSATDMSEWDAKE